MFDSVQFGKSIRHYRQQLGLQINDFALSLDTGYKYLGDIELGNKVPSVTLAIDILNKLKLNFDECLNQDELKNVREIKMDHIISVLNQLNDREREYLLKISELLAGD